MKKYRVLCWRIHYGYYDIEAENEKEAQVKANERLWDGQELDGTNDFEAGVEEVAEV